MQGQVADTVRPLCILCAPRTSKNVMAAMSAALRDLGDLAILPCPLSLWEREPSGGQIMTVATHNNGLPEVVRPTCTVQHVLRGQKALVTDANSGIGLGVALALGRAGA